MTDASLTPTNDTCKTCRFWNYTGVESGAECRRNPPTVMVWTMIHDGISSQAGFEQHWPWMTPDQWCGQHEPNA